MEDLVEFNKRLNKRFGMDNLEHHPNPIIKLEEWNRRRILRKLVSDTSGKVITDIGCEQGYTLAGLCAEALGVYAVDIDDNLLKIAEQRIKKSFRLMNQKVRTIQSDAEDIKMEDNISDITISSCVLEHLQDPQKAIDELLRITKPGGKVVLNVPNDAFVLRVKSMLRKLHLSFILGKLAKGLAPGHIQVFTRDSLLDMIAGKARIMSFRRDYPFNANMFVVFRPKTMPPEKSPIKSPPCPICDQPMLFSRELYSKDRKFGYDKRIRGWYCAGCGSVRTGSIKKK